MEYKDVLETQKEKLRNDLKWWPDFLYHFTDVHNASGILYNGWILSRQQATEQAVMINDNASRAVIEATGVGSKSYGRLYFRPLTPTQYHNEGYKPLEVRNRDINACCPVPIFLCLSSDATLNLAGTKFAEKGISGSRNNILEGVEAFSSLDFAKIYHEGPYSQEHRDIKDYRHSEVIREGGFPVGPLLRCILCRTQAERETLLYLLRQYSMRLYNTYKSKVLYNPSLKCFYQNGIFVKNVAIRDNVLVFDFNDPEQRFKKQEECDVTLRVDIELAYKNADGSICSVQRLVGDLNYCLVRSCSVGLKKELDYNAVKVTLMLDDAIMYENELDINNAIF